uniref:Uncharacterized protein n=1 Tax=Anguilla anguilla TaxID=7936 RepID=A0A0E9R0P8_ANGAN
MFLRNFIPQEHGVFLFLYLLLRFCSE